MRITIDPAPFDPAAGYAIEVEGGTPPYTFTPLPAPPNPPGVTVQVTGNTAQVQVQPNPPPGTQVHVLVSDSARPPASAPTTNAVA